MFNFLKDPQRKILKDLNEKVNAINQLEPKFEIFSNAQLREHSLMLKEKANQGEFLDNVLPEAFALIREASKRTLGQRHFDVQLEGGIVLHKGTIAEMKTGEGKTLAATAPAYLNALEGKGVHIVTVNDYLAKRDAVWMGQIYDLLGISIACLVHDAAHIYDPEFRPQNSDEERDIVGGFRVVEEFLRPVSRKEAYQCDIVYGTNHEFGFDYLRDNLVSSLQESVQRELNYAIIDEIDSILIDEARTPLIISAPDVESPQWYRTFAKLVPKFKEGDDYAVNEKLRSAILTEAGISKVENALGIKNLYQEGMHLLHYLEESLKAYALFKRDHDYVVKNGEIIIVDEFTGRLLHGRRYSEGLHQAIEAKEDVRVREESRTLATITIQNYFRLYKKIAGMTGTALTSAEEFHKVYNLEVVQVSTHRAMIRQDLPDKIFKSEIGKFKALVKEIKERHKKGQPILVGTISIEKNEILSSMLEKEGVSHNVLNAKHHEREGEIIAQAGKLGKVTVATNMAGRGVDIILGGNPFNKEEAEKVKELGGLHVIGTERHEARRIDNQLRGRSGRQGDPGSSRFFVSLEDNLLRIFGGERIKRLMDRFNIPEDEPIENKMVSKAIENAQGRVEGYNLDIRRHILEYDDVLNKQRDAIYKWRRSVLEEFKEKPSEMKRFLEENIEGLAEEEKAKFKKIIGEKEKELGEEFFSILKSIFLQSIDFYWMEHLTTLDYLRDAVRLRAYGQRDPLVEYKRDAHRIFQELLATIKDHIVQSILALEEVKLAAFPVAEVQAARSSDFLKVGRNDPCPCNSGKKFKKCHGR